jgi:hypothetical protein
MDAAGLSHGFYAYSDAGYLHNEVWLEAVALRLFQPGSDSRQRVNTGTFCHTT